LDDDIAKSPIIRQCESQKWVPAHKVQHLYLLPVYALSSIFWIFFMDFAKYFTGKIYTTEAWVMTSKNKAIFWVTKLGYLTFYIVLPIIKWGFFPWLAGFFLSHVAMGLTLSIVFQLAHVVENTEFEHVGLDETKHIDEAWAIHELKTTSNFAMDSKLVSWFVGGLNFQVEHHLFPKVSHIHYPAISKIVQQKCKEYNLPYNYYPTMLQAVASHFRVMKSLGKKPAEMQAQIAA
jgi:linoleoyl-CoA desaturase